MSAIFRKPVQKPNPLAESRNNHLEKAQSNSLISQDSLLDHPPIIIPSLAAPRSTSLSRYNYPFKPQLRQPALLLSTEACTIIVLYILIPSLKKTPNQDASYLRTFRFTVLICKVVGFWIIKICSILFLRLNMSHSYSLGFYSFCILILLSIPFYPPLLYSTPSPPSTPLHLLPLPSSLRPSATTPLFLRRITIPHAPLPPLPPLHPPQPHHRPHKNQSHVPNPYPHSKAIPKPLHSYQRRINWFLPKGGWDER